MNQPGNNSGKYVPTASQTVGPFFSIGLCPRSPNNLVPERPPAGAEIVTIRGCVLDGDGQGVPDAILEIWRADSNGKYASDESDCDPNGVPGGFARIPTGERGEFEFRTLKPGSILEKSGDVHAPHLAVVIFMRGLLRHLLTRVYLPQEPGNESDPVLKAVPAERRKTLIAIAQPGSSLAVQWDIHLQGDAETVFFEA